MAEGASAIAAVGTASAIESSSVIDTQAVETPTTDVQANATQQPGTEQQPTTLDGEQPTTDVAADLANVPQLVKKAIDQLKTSDPVAARALRDYFHQQQAFSQEFPGGLKEARELKQTIETLGGTEGIQSLQAEKQGWTQIDEKFAQGDASVLDTFAQQSPEGFAKLIPASLDKLAAVNPEAYSHALARPFVATLDSWQFPALMDGLIANLSQVVDQNGQPLLAREVQELTRMAQQYDGLKQTAAKMPEKQLNPERQKLDQERHAFQQEKQTAFRAEIDAETQKYAVAKYDALISAEQKAGIALPEAGTRSYQTMLREIDGEIAREMAKDRGILQKLNALDATGKKAELVAFLNAKFDAYAPRVVQRVVKEWQTTKNPQGAAKKPVQQVTQGPAKLAEAPSQEQIDWSRCNRSDVMNRRAYLKGRAAQVTW